MGVWGSAAPGGSGVLGGYIRGSIRVRRLWRINIAPASRQSEVRLPGSFAQRQVRGDSVGFQWQIARKTRFGPC